MRPVRTRLALCAFFGALLFARPARAQEFDFSNLGPTGDQVKAALFMVFVTGPLVVANISVTVMHTSRVVDGQRSSDRLQAAGYTLGGAGILAGTVLLVVSAANSRSTFGTWLETTGVLSLGVGALDIGFTIWSAHEPDAASQHPALSLSVYMPQDRTGRAAPGLQLALVSF